MKKITALIFLWTVFFGCEESAREFDFSKDVDFVFPVDQITTTNFDTTATLDFADHSAIKDYSDYSEGYQINGLTFSIEPMVGNVAITGTFEGVVVIDGDSTDLFSLTDYSLVASEKVPLTISNSLIQQLTDDINENGQLNFSLTYAGDQQPGSLIFTLYFDTTVAAQLDF